jgi:hypothetical protein
MLKREQLLTAVDLAEDLMTTRWIAHTEARKALARILWQKQWRAERMARKIALYKEGEGGKKIA